MKRRENKARIKPKNPLIQNAYNLPTKRKRIAKLIIEINAKTYKENVYKDSY